MAKFEVNEGHFHLEVTEDDKGQNVFTFFFERVILRYTPKLFMGFASTIITAEEKICSNNGMPCMNGCVLAEEKDYLNEFIQVIAEDQEEIVLIVGSFLVRFNYEEYAIFADCVKKTMDYLLMEKEIDPTMIDINALDWGWLSLYDEIKTITPIRYKIGEMYGLKNLFQKKYLQAIVPLKRSDYVQAFRYFDTETETFRPNPYIDDEENKRLTGLFSFLKENRYPYNNERILIDEYGDIWNGYHRAACLLYIYGAEKEIEVNQIIFKDKSIVKPPIIKTLVRVKAGIKGRVRQGLQKG